MLCLSESSVESGGKNQVSFCCNNLLNPRLSTLYCYLFSFEIKDKKEREIGDNRWNSRVESRTERKKNDTLKQLFKKFLQKKHL